ncbi:hypothetical protein DCCM_3403 [Desulfocucumis palustris]|uniref:Uncharacterized protein n=1 Tax=Desulfocucumis palustris TaxID=1898651 RepID=A0A2L2XK53_9FIRM|nr:hypothetical protein DCCM_3403 [Desulfocucumis palustris]
MEISPRFKHRPKTRSINKHGAKGETGQGKSTLRPEPGDNSAAAS